MGSETRMKAGFSFFMPEIYSDITRTQLTFKMANRRYAKPLKTRKFNYVEVPASATFLRRNRLWKGVATFLTKVVGQKWDMFNVCVGGFGNKRKKNVFQI